MCVCARGVSSTNSVITTRRAGGGEGIHFFFRSKFESSLPNYGSLTRRKEILQSSVTNLASRRGGYDDGRTWGNGVIPKGNTVLALGALTYVW